MGFQNYIDIGFLRENLDLKHVATKNQQIKIDLILMLEFALQI